MIRHFAALVLLAGLHPVAAQAQTRPQAEPGWEFAVTPYLWAPSIDGKLRYGVPPNSGGTSSADVKIDSVNLLESLDAAAMIAAEARHGRFSVLADYIYLSLGNSSSQVRSVGFGGAGGEAVS